MIVKFTLICPWCSSVSLMTSYNPQDVFRSYVSVDESIKINPSLISRFGSCPAYSFLYFLHHNSKISHFPLKEM